MTRDESVSIAMLALLESLGPAERSALMLRDVLGLPYDEVSEVLGRSQAACRGLVTRARTHIRAHAPRFTPDRAQHTEAVRAFLAACSHGRVDELVRVLDPNVVLRSDGGGLVPGVALRPVIGSDHVARLLLGVAAKHAATSRIDTVNGSARSGVRSRWRGRGGDGVHGRRGPDHRDRLCRQPRETASGRPAVLGNTGREGRRYSTWKPWAYGSGRSFGTHGGSAGSQNEARNGDRVVGHRQVAAAGKHLEISGRVAADRRGGTGISGAPGRASRRRPSLERRWAP